MPPYKGDKPKRKLVASKLIINSLTCCLPLTIHKMLILCVLSLGDYLFKWEVLNDIELLHIKLNAQIQVGG
jgi:hypothetical protein